MSSPSKSKSSNSEDGYKVASKRIKLDSLVIHHIHNSHHTELRWQLSQFTLCQKVVDGKTVEWYESPNLHFKSLKWRVVMRPIHYAKEKDVYPTNWGNNESECVTLMECEIIVSGGDKEENEDATDFYIEVSCQRMEKDEFGLEQIKSSNFSKFCHLYVGPEEKSILQWTEHRLFMGVKANDSDDLITAKIFEIVSLDHARVFKQQRKLVAKIKEDAKGVEMFLKLINANNEIRSSTEDFWIKSKAGTTIGFHKAILKIRGSDFHLRCLSKEPGPSRCKLTKYEDKTILGFKEYLYNGKLPNLESNAIEYFKFADFYKMDEIKDLAELELCKRVDIVRKETQNDEIGLNEVYELAKIYPTKYLKEAFIEAWKQKDGHLESIVRKNFDKIDPFTVLN